MAGNSGKQKRKVFFIKGDGSISTSPQAPGDKKMPSPWNSGKSRNKYKKIRS